MRNEKYEIENNKQHIGDRKMSELKLNLNKVIKAPQEAVFNAWLNPITISKFMLPMPGMKAPKVEVDAVIGGAFSIVMYGQEEMLHKGKYLEITPSSKLVFTWESAFSPENSTVTLEFSKIDAHTTNIELTHLKFYSEETRTQHEGGWGNILDTLLEVCEKKVEERLEV